MSRSSVTRSRGMLAFALLIPLVLSIVAITAIDRPQAEAGATAAGASAAGTSAGQAVMAGQPALRAAIVNQDKLVMQNVDGKDVPVPAGRLLVGQLVDSTESGFDWTVTDAATAQDGLDSGDFAVVITIPSSFSADYISSAGPDPVQAELQVATNGAHSYLAAVLARALSLTVDDALATQLTQGYLTGMIDGFTDVGVALGQAGEGAGSLASGIAQIHEGAAVLPGATADLAEGMRMLDNGVASLSSGLGELERLSTATSDTSVALALELAALAVVVAGDETVPQYVKDSIVALQLHSDVAALAAAGTNYGVGIAGEASGMIESGASALAEGSDQLAAGLPLLVDGLAVATDGSQTLAEGLDQAAAAIPQHTPDQSAALARVVATPIVTTSSMSPALPTPVGALAAVIVPLALWLGALALSLVRGTFDPRAVRSRSGNGKIVRNAVLPWFGWSLVQAALVLVGAWVAGIAPVHHLGLVGLVCAASVAFALLHQGLHAVLGRYAWLVSLALLSVQLVAAGVVFPAVLASPAVQQLGDVLPLSQAISGAQALIAGGSVDVAVSAVVALGFTALLGLVLTMVAVSRARMARAPVALAA